MIAPETGLVHAAKITPPMTQRTCQITFQNMATVEAAKVEVHAWLEKLGPLATGMTGGHVVIDAVKERRGEQRYQVRMEIAMPNQVVVIEHGHPRNAAHEDVYVAIRNAFRAAKDQLEIYSAAQPAIDLSDGSPTASG